MNNEVIHCILSQMCICGHTGYAHGSQTSAICFNCSCASFKPKEKKK